MVAVRAKEHNCTLDKGIHHSPKHMAQARAHRALHGAWPPFTVHEVLCSMEGETWDAFVRRVIRAERRELVRPRVGRDRRGCGVGGGGGGAAVANAAAGAAARRRMRGTAAAERLGARRS
jgi:hypothetical protein